VSIQLSALSFSRLLTARVYIVRPYWLGCAEGESHFPAAVALDKEGNVYVADTDNHRIQKFTAEGKFITEWGEFGEAPGRLSVPSGIAVDASGNVYVSDNHNHRIQKFARVSSR
jgi:DNA-binding beta-propeller fold protein YncE